MNSSFCKCVKMISQVALTFASSADANVTYPKPRERPDERSYNKEKVQQQKKKKKKDQVNRKDKKTKWK